jgi:sarcosine oxidase subunit gamma
MLPPAARFVMQGGPPARAVASGLFGAALSEQACRASQRGDRAALWLGPGEHLLLARAEDAGILLAGLESALSGVSHSLVDISHRQISLRLGGRSASAILNTGCPLDLDEAAFPAGMCTRTLLGKADIVLWRTGAAEFQLEVWRSFSDYVSRWLLEAARDFAVPG